MTAGHPHPSGPGPVPPPGAAVPPRGTVPPRVPLGAAPPPGARRVDPGETLAVVGLVLAFVCSVAGIVVSAVARSRSRAAGYDGGLATAGLAASVTMTVLQALVVVAVVVALVVAGIAALASYAQDCAVSTQDGWQVTCSAEQQPGGAG